MASHRPYGTMNSSLVTANTTSMNTVSNSVAILTKAVEDSNQLDKYWQS